MIRATVLQLLTPDSMRGRVSAVSVIFIGTSNEIGELESGVAAQWLGLVPAVARRRRDDAGDGGGRGRDLAGAGAAGVARAPGAAGTGGSRRVALLYRMNCELAGGRQIEENPPPIMRRVFFKIRSIDSQGVQTIAAVANVILALAALVGSVAVALHVHYSQARAEQLSFFHSLGQSWISVDLAALSDDKLLVTADNLMDPANVGEQDINLRRKRWFAYSVMNLVLAALQGGGGRDSAA